MDAGTRLDPAVTQTASEIETMETRGAAAIADAAAYALAKQAESSSAETATELEAELYAAARTLADTRPTAVSLPNALRFVLSGRESADFETLRETILAQATEFRENLNDARDRLGHIGAGRFTDGDRILMHCHSTDAMACIEAAVEQGRTLSAIVKETRPRNQGQITATELRELGVPVTYIVDNAAHRFLDEADHVLVGADSIAADGSVVNKIGTAGLAVSARDRGVPVIVAAQSIKLHPKTLTGAAVEIEERSAEEVLSSDSSESIESVDIANPAFDVTPPRHIDAIVTEYGQFPPESIVFLMRELFGEDVDDPWNSP